VSDKLFIFSDIIVNFVTKIIDKVKNKKNEKEIKKEDEINE
jgi:hypothetical protein